MIPERPGWNEMIARLPEPHFMQTTEWAQVKAQTGWMPFFFVWYPDGNAYKMQVWENQPDLPAAAAMVLQRTIAPAGFALKLRLLYVPKGPLLDWENAHLRQKVLSDLKMVSRQKGAIFIKIDPDVILGKELPDQPDGQNSPMGAAVVNDLSAQAWQFSDEQIQFKNTVLIDLLPGEDELLQKMKQKTRYNIRLAERKGVTVRAGTPSDFQTLYQIYAETAVRDGFIIRPESYYRSTWDIFYQAKMAEILIAEFNQEILGAVILLTFAQKGWYVYGMSRDIHREKMPNYLLQWHAMLRLKQRNCAAYDLWGAPDEFVEADPLWNVFRFKEGLGGKVIRHIGAWDLPTHPLLYRLYAKILPRILDQMRKRSKTSLRQNVGI